MPEAFFLSLFPYILGAMSILFGVVWNFLLKRIETLEKNQKICPVHSMKDDVATIKNDIQWLKKFLIDEKK